MLKKIFVFIALTIIVLFLLAVGSFICSKIFMGKEPAYIGTVAGAFMGAFFAFIFVRFASFFAGLSERQNKHYNALVEIEQIANDYLNTILDDISIIDNFERIMQKSTELVPSVPMGKMYIFTIHKEIPLKLSNIDLINDFYSFNIVLDKMNKSIDTINKSYAEIKEPFIHKLINYQTYYPNTIECVRNALVIKKHLAALEKETKTILAQTRILLKEKPIFNYFMFFMSPKHLSTKQKEQIPEEIEKMEREILDIRRESQEKINEISGNPETPGTPARRV